MKIEKVGCLLAIALTINASVGMAQSSTAEDSLVSGSVPPDDSIVIPASFPRTSVMGNTLLGVFKQCIQTPAPDLERTLDSNGDFFVQGFEVTDPKSGSTFIVAKGVSICIRASRQGYPILALETLRDSIKFDGVDGDTSLQWLTRTLRRLATSGNSVTAFRRANGSLKVVTHAVSKNRLTSNGIVRFYVRELPSDAEMAAINADEVVSDPRLSEIHIHQLNSLGIGYITLRL